MSPTDDSLKDLMSFSDIAKKLGVKRSSVQLYHRRARLNREAGIVRAGDMPEPDLQTPRSPMWKTATVEDWAKTRRPYRRTQKDEL
jgi:hypothetical protein